MQDEKLYIEYDNQLFAAYLPDHNAVIIHDKYLTPQQSSKFAAVEKICLLRRVKMEKQNSMHVIWLNHIYPLGQFLKDTKLEINFEYDIDENINTTK